MLVQLESQNHFFCKFYIVFAKEEDKVQRDGITYANEYMPYKMVLYNSINAYNQLAEYYHDAGESKKALEFAALSSITSFSRIIEISLTSDAVCCYTFISYKTARKLTIINLRACLYL